MNNINWNDYKRNTGVANDLGELVGEKLASVSGLSENSGEVVFVTESGKAIKLYYEQDCCESVVLDDYESDVSDWNGATVISAEEVIGDAPVDDLDYYESVTWTFYKIETDRGGLWMRWCGESNGYYSESVDVLGGVVV